MFILMRGGYTEEFVRVCRDELDAHFIYSTIARIPFIDRRLRDVLARASKDELRHYEFWRSVVGECPHPLSMLKVALFTLTSLLFGVTFTFRVLESMEGSAADTYGVIVEQNPSLSNEVTRIELDERLHEAEFMRSIDEGRVRYLGSIALGVSDALVELTGIYAGTLGAFASSVSAGLTGLLAGFAASASMGVAAYTQARHEGGKSPIRSAAYTTLAYITVSSLLALPYFTLASPVLSFTVMIAIALAITSYMALYTSVLYGKRFLREFVETAVPLFGVSFLLLALGTVLREILGVGL